MKLVIVQDTRRPLYENLADAIRDVIRSKGIKVGGRLPSVRDIADRYDLSRDIVFQAYSLLEREGLIESVERRGYFVAQDPKTKRRQRLNEIRTMLYETSKKLKKRGFSSEEIEEIYHELGTRACSKRADRPGTTSTRNSLAG